MDSTEEKDLALRDKLNLEYQELAPILHRFRNELVKQLEALLANEQISLAVPIESRVKTWESISSKLDRLDLNLSSLRQLQDFVGIRLLVLFRRDAETLNSVLSTTFTVMKREDTSVRLREDQFGYLSTHFLVTLPEGWLTVPSMVSLRNVTAEIQVRTVTQHIWAAASHLLQYKKEENVPPPIRRTIHRVSALLETVDLEFERVLKEREDYRKEVVVDSKELLNADSLEKLLEALLPAANKAGDENYSLMLDELGEIGVATAEQLGGVLKKHLNAVLENDARKVERYSKEKEISSHERDRILNKKVYFTHVGLVRVAMRKEFGKRWDKYMLRVALRHMRKDDPRRGVVEKQLEELQAVLLA